MKAKIYRFALSAALGLSFPLICLSLIPRNAAAFISEPVQCKSAQSPAVPLPVAPAAADELRFVALGDTGNTCEEEPRKCELVKKMLEIQKQTGYNLLFLLGDNVYQSGNPNEFGAKLFAPYKPLFDGGVLIRGVIGNHDTRNDDGAVIQVNFFTAANTGEQARFFNARWNDGEWKNLKIAPITQSYYQFREKEKLVEFFALDSTMLARNWDKKKKKYPRNTAQEQIAWLRESLKKSKEAGVKWRVVVMHHPLYSSATQHGVTEVDGDGNEIKDKLPDEIRQTRAAIEQLLKDYDARVVLAGHDHLYERIVPQTEKKIYHFVSGAGSELRTEDFQLFENKKKRPRLPNFHHCGDNSQLSFMLFSVKPDAIRFWTIGMDGQPFDSGEIK